MTADDVGSSGFVSVTTLLGALDVSEIMRDVVWDRMPLNCDKMVGVIGADVDDAVTVDSELKESLAVLLGSAEGNEMMTDPLVVALAVSEELDPDADAVPDADTVLESDPV